MATAASILRNCKKNPTQAIKSSKRTLETEKINQLMYSSSFRLVEKAIGSQTATKRFWSRIFTANMDGGRREEEVTPRL